MFEDWFSTGTIKGGSDGNRSRKSFKHQPPCTGSHEVWMIMSRNVHVIWLIRFLFHSIKIAVQGQKGRKLACDRSGCCLLWLTSALGSVKEIALPPPPMPRLLTWKFCMQSSDLALSQRTTCTFLHTFSQVPFNSLPMGHHNLSSNLENCKVDHFLGGRWQQRLSSCTHQSPKHLLRHLLKISI